MDRILIAINPVTRVTYEAKIDTRTTGNMSKLTAVTPGQSLKGQEIAWAKLQVDHMLPLSRLIWKKVAPQGASNQRWKTFGTAFKDTIIYKQTEAARSGSPGSPPQVTLHLSLTPRSCRRVGAPCSLLK